MTIELLSPEEFTRWDGLVDRSPHGTVFHYSWWLEAAGYEFKVLVCRDGKGELVAGIPLPRKRRSGLTLFHSPRLTPYLGPIFDVSKARSLPEGLSMMRHLGESLARAIKGYDSFRYMAGAAAPDLQGFLWAGFEVQLGYTFRFEAGASVEEVLEGMVRQHRQNLVRAQRSGMTVELGDHIDALTELNKQTYSRQGLSLPYAENVVSRLWAAAQRRGRGNIYLARDAKGIPAAALLVVHDNRSTYQIVSGGNYEMRSSPGGYLVAWQAIQDTLLAGRSFDFEGSYLRGVERFYRYWGAVPRPVWCLEKAGSLRGSIARALFKAVQRNRD